MLSIAPLRQKKCRNSTKNFRTPTAMKPAVFPCAPSGVFPIEGKHRLKHKTPVGVLCCRRRRRRAGKNYRFRHGRCSVQKRPSRSQYAKQPVRFWKTSEKNAPTVLILNFLFLFAKRTKRQRTKRPEIKSAFGVRPPATKAVTAQKKQLPPKTVEFIARLPNQYPKYRQFFESCRHGDRYRARSGGWDPP